VRSSDRHASNFNAVDYEDLKLRRIAHALVVSVNISDNKGERKTPVTECNVDLKGLVSDAHRGDWHRQVSLLDLNRILEFCSFNPEVGFGSFAENITFLPEEGFSFEKGDVIEFDSGLRLEVTQLGKLCHDRCDIYGQVGRCIMPEFGIFASIKNPGCIKAGDRFWVSRV